MEVILHVFALKWKLNAWKIGNLRRNADKFDFGKLLAYRLRSQIHTYSSINDGIWISKPCHIIHYNGKWFVSVFGCVCVFLFPFLHRYRNEEFVHWLLNDKVLLFTDDWIHTVLTLRIKKKQKKNRPVSNRNGSDKKVLESVYCLYFILYCNVLLSFNKLLVIYSEIR